MSLCWHEVNFGGFKKGFFRKTAMEKRVYRVTWHSAVCVGRGRRLCSRQIWRWAAAAIVQRGGSCVIYTAGAIVRRCTVYIRPCCATVSYTTGGPIKNEWESFLFADLVWMYPPRFITRSTEKDWKKKKESNDSACQVLKAEMRDVQKLWQIWCLENMESSQTEVCDGKKEPRLKVVTGQFKELDAGWISAAMRVGMTWRKRRKHVFGCLPTFNGHVISISTVLHRHFKNIAHKSVTLGSSCARNVIEGRGQEPQKKSCTPSEQQVHYPCTVSPSTEPNYSSLKSNFQQQPVTQTNRLKMVLTRLPPPPPSGRLR